MEEHTLEEELEIRNKIALKIGEVINELNFTIDFALHKMQYISESHFSNRQFIPPMLDMIIEEFENTRKRISDFKKIKNSAILPLPEIGEMNIKGCWNIHSIAEKLFPDGTMNNDIYLFKSQFLFVRTREIDYRKAKRLDDEAILREFAIMRERHAADQERKHQILREETYTPKESFREFIDRSKTIEQVRIWNRTDHDILKTIAEMRAQKMTEHDLLPLIQYLDKYEFLRQLVNEHEASTTKPARTKTTIKKKYSGILSSPEAEVFWSKLRKAKIVDKNNQPLNLSWSQAAYLAHFLAEKLAIDDMWKEFGEYWNLDKAALKSNYYRGIEYSSLKDFNALLNGLFD